MIGVGLLCVGQPASADADSLNDFLGPREIGLGEAMRADARGGASTTLNPAGLSLSHEVAFEGSYSNRSHDGAWGLNLSGCDSTVPVPGCFYYNYFIAEPEVSGQKITRRVHQFGIVAARALTPNLIIGTNTKYFDYKSNDLLESDSSGVAVDLGLILRANQMINVALVGYNLVAADSTQYPRGAATGITIRPLPSLGLGFDALWKLERAEGEKAGRYSAGAEYFLQSSTRRSGFPLRIGGVYAPEGKSRYLTAGVGFLSEKIGVDVGARRQLHGEKELMVQASLRLFGPTL